MNARSHILPAYRDAFEASKQWRLGNHARLSITTQQALDSHIQAHVDERPGYFQQFVAVLSGLLKKKKLKDDEGGESEQKYRERYGAFLDDVGELLARADNDYQYDSPSDQADRTIMQKGNDMKAYAEFDILSVPESGDLPTATDMAALNEYLDAQAAESPEIANIIKQVETLMADMDAEGDQIAGESSADPSDLSILPELR